MRGKLSAGQLSEKYAILHRIGSTIWVPTNHNSTIAAGLGRFLYVVRTKMMFDYGTHIFDHTLTHTATSATKFPIAFPSLICGIILKQHPGIFCSTDVVCKRECALSLHEKLFARKHVPNIVLASAEKKSSTKADIISALKETCKNLDEIINTSTKRKITIEQLIKNLE